MVDAVKLSVNGVAVVPARACTGGRLEESCGLGRRLGGAWLTQSSFR
jgi:hypothetical protein